jgi:hypothetical protein
VFVFVDFLALTVGLFVELLLILLGQVAVVCRHVLLFVILQALLAFFQIRGLSRRELTILHAVGNAVLLILFALVDLVDPRMVGIIHARAGARSVGLLRSGGSDKHQTTHCKNCEHLRNFGHANVNPRQEV